nr:unnamed protein product [Callosobruchus chinensis]
MKNHTTVGEGSANNIPEKIHSAVADDNEHAIRKQNNIQNTYLSCPGSSKETLSSRPKVIDESLLSESEQDPFATSDVSNYSDYTPKLKKKTSRFYNQESTTIESSSDSDIHSKIKKNRCERQRNPNKENEKFDIRVVPRGVLQQFIDCYRAHPALWQVKNKELYTNRNMKNQGYLELVKDWKRFDPEANQKIVKSKIQSLRGYFRKELKKMSKSYGQNNMAHQFLEPPLSKNRFNFLIKNLRFDDKTSRNGRKELDKFSAIRKIWDSYMRNCQDNYTPSEYVTVDEQLLGFRGRCPFRMYLPNKPEKYGIKIVMLCDAKTFYMLSAIPYIGKEDRQNTLPIPSQYVLELSEPIHRTNRNITLDNWFTSVGLTNSLIEVGLTVVGTLRKNKPEIPPEFLKQKISTPNRFAFTQDVVLVSHTPRENKVVMLLSTMHTNDEVDQSSGKSEVNLFYNATKGGVDVFDQLCHSKSTARRTKR